MKDVMLFKGLVEGFRNGYVQLGVFLEDDGYAVQLPCSNYMAMKWKDGAHVIKVSLSESPDNRLGPPLCIKEVKLLKSSAVIGYTMDDGLKRFFKVPSMTTGANVAKFIDGRQSVKMFLRVDEGEADELISEEIDRERVSRKMMGVVNRWSQSCKRSGHLPNPYLVASMDHWCDEGATLVSMIEADIEAREEKDNDRTD